MRRMIVAVLLLLFGASPGLVRGQTEVRELLKLEGTIPMPDVQGRIDHLAVDVRGRRLFVAALGNNSLEVIDLAKNSRIHTVRGLAEPQGIAYVPSLNRVFVANGQDGSVRSFDTGSWARLKSIAYGDDADNLRLDPGNGHIWVGFGAGALGEFDPDGNRVREIKLDAHPESFQMEKKGLRVYVNLPNSKKIDVIDRARGTILASWSTGGPQANYPMALNEPDHRLFVVTRSPAKLIVFNTDTGERLASLPAVGDCDDVFYDERRHRIYAIGGEGGISVFEQKDPDHYAELGQLKIVPGARTGFFSPDLDRLFVAVRKQGSQPAEIRVYSPVE
jgi:YVTN family beta-propeller protein